MERCNYCREKVMGKYVCQNRIEKKWVEQRKTPLLGKWVQKIRGTIFVITDGFRGKSPS